VHPGRGLAQVTAPTVRVTVPPRRATQVNPAGQVHAAAVVPPSVTLLQVVAHVQRWVASARHGSPARWSAHGSPLKAGALVAGGPAPGPVGAAGTHAVTSAASRSEVWQNRTIGASKHTPARSPHPAGDEDQGSYGGPVLIGAMKTSGMPRPSTRKGTDPSAQHGKTRLAVEALPM
jgi:hypothetical protein